ncbi:peptidase, partial [bacterium]|nr:peptidase [bacterium]
MSIKKLFLIFCLFVTVAATQVCTKGPSEVTTPEEQYGHIVGADYILLNNTQIADYWRKLAEESDRMSIEEMGKSTEGRPMLMGIITSPENQKRLARYKEISKQLALAEGLTDEEAHELAKEGRAMVWIDAGMHANEIVNVPALTEMIYQMVSRNDAETLRFLDDVILLAVCTNPDGLDLVPNWYMRKEDPKERSFRDIPRLYQKYIGHDNARDCFMANTSETINNNRILYREWFPQILYNQHQTGPAGTVLFCAPFRDPFNYNYDPLVVLGINLVGNAMHTRFVAEDKPGSAMRQEASYSTWWNGCPRCTAYFHNVIGILTEINGSPTPMEIPFIPRWHLPRNNYPYPIAPQKWHFRQAIDYLVTADRAVLDTASKHREEILFNRYLMGKRNIERGSRDHWTITPKRI